MAYNTYDDKGNIVAIYENSKLTECYTYDSLNQLVREDSAKSSTTTIYNYDNGGNILETKKYAYTDGELGEVLSTNTYTYSDSEWKDLLTAYNGQTITYDEIGNPLSYRDGFNFTWKNGRQLSTLQDDDSVVEYTYNINGIRTSKTVNGLKTDYTLNNTTIIAETTNGKTTWYDYDASGMPVGFTADEQSYYYKKNAQGDIVAILDSDGVELAGYTYDAWGNITAISGDETLAESNPFRYRGYYQDNESGFFYLQSRYYDSGIGRFLNADSQVNDGVIGTNIYTYASNNPIIYCDYDGKFAIPAIPIILAAAVFFIGSMALIYLISTPGFQRSWSQFCQIVGQSVNVVVDWFTQIFVSIYDRVKSSIQSLVQKATTIIRNERYRYDYWIALKISFSNNAETYIPTKGIPYSVAISYVRSGGDVFASSRSNAKRLAVAVGYGNSNVPEEIHSSSSYGRLGFFWHYHDAYRRGGHIFYL